MTGLNGATFTYDLGSHLMSAQSISSGTISDSFGYDAFQGGYRQASGEYGGFLGLHEGAIGEHGALGIGVSLPTSWGNFLDNLLGHKPQRPCPK